MGWSHLAGKEEGGDGAQSSASEGERSQKSRPALALKIHLAESPRVMRDERIYPDITPAALAPKGAVGAQPSSCSL